MLELYQKASLDQAEGDQGTTARCEAPKQNDGKRERDNWDKLIYEEGDVIGVNKSLERSSRGG